MAEPTVPGGPGATAPAPASADRLVRPGSQAWADVCRSDELVDGGDGVRFRFPGADGEVSAFVVRSQGVARAYVNRCSHVAVELDWLPGRFFDESGLYLICSTHGATYRASDGACAGGPCRGRALSALETSEADGMVRVKLRSVASEVIG